MKCLLLDSSNTLLSVGLKIGGQLIDKISYPCFQRQSEFMVCEIDKILKRNQINPKEINAIVVSIGPGSYTGIRIALTIAKVFSLSLSIPIYPISTLEANKSINKKSIVLFNARSNRSYIAAFNNNKRILDDQVMDNNKVLKYISAHPDYELIGDLSYLNLNGKTNDVLNNLNVLFSILKPIQNPDLIKPVYLKDSYL